MYAYVCMYFLTLAVPVYLIVLFCDYLWFFPLFFLDIIKKRYNDKKKKKKELSSKLKGVLHPWALFLKTLCIFSKNKATLDKVSYGSGQKCSKKHRNHSFTSVETLTVKLQWKMCENQYFTCFEP